ncbi:choline BCCT transporter BetT [Microbacterium profundi]|uniref:Choline BCCT transporter BetT n=1 Tax=Microbacterium profundi TaxID=450380 RepID=A0ABV3LDK2_9MICO|nr:choline BCCT transporter BetT [Microbacterium profundi]MCE7482550.1 choline BCCT transporter BetT [Microbacterium profundi]
MPEDTSPPLPVIKRSTVPPPRWPVLIGSAAAILAIALWAIFAPVQAGEVIGVMVGWIATNFGWYFVLTAAIVVVFVLILAFSSVGRTKLGPDHSKPQFSMFTWASMLFAAGIGIDLMFFAVSEPAAQYMNPPTGEGETIAAARQAIVWTFFHYGPVGWAMYALMGAAFAYFAYRLNKPLTIRSVLSPIFGRFTNGWVGHSVDIFTVLGTVFGIATTLGIGVVQLSYGMHVLFGTPDGVSMQIALIVLAVAMATISTVSGVEKGIRRLSEANVILAIILLLWITITGQTRRILDGLVMNVGDFFATFPSLLMETFAWERPDAWMQGWTLFFWAWWVAWAPFVGLFLARISRGRTLRQFIVGVLLIPFAFIAIFVSIFGNSALEIILGGDTAFAESAVNTPERAFFDLLQQYPAAPIVLAVALLTGLLFYVTSADSGALVLANLTSKMEDPRQDAGKLLRVFWALATGLLTLGMLLVGGVPTLQAATLIIGLPVSLLLYLVMISLYRSLGAEKQRRAGYLATIPGRFGPTQTNWRQRLRRSTVYPTRSQVITYLGDVAAPALEDVKEELCAAGVDAVIETIDIDGLDMPSLILTVHFNEGEDFTYQLYPVAHELPSYAYLSVSGAGHYFRLEVFSAIGSRGYDVYGYTTDQLITDVLSSYESHLEYLRLTADVSESVFTEALPVITDWQDDFLDPASSGDAAADGTEETTVKETP